MKFESNICLSFYRSGQIASQQFLRDLLERVSRRRASQIKHPDHVETIFRPDLGGDVFIAQDVCGNVGDVFALPANATTSSNMLSNSDRWKLELILTASF
jgi:hypothetical protein